MFDSAKKSAHGFCVSPELGPVGALQAAFPLPLKCSCKCDHSPGICHSAQETILGSTDLLECSPLLHFP